ncbi:hypothetical protein DRW03_24695 [Corallococcus sp. H22C18031201]|uniref:hypothetical protein n=1 Tax=Citreicoccus inhibens TaxID=2849499 RepID=UPI000E71663D|nr:hypothetical protein [Citreicoccus inhibens]MBU8900261.1 hypothetical protein [Citreicoccus inhibens]RJS18335.1 hypothetical protein DRW03_24695 [Corallococcus sp. H22C18031201]
MRRMWMGVGAGALWLSACTHESSFRRDPNDEDALTTNIPVVKAPASTRCAAHGKSSVRASCDEALYLGTEYTRRLAVGDEVCLEGGYGEQVGPACKARAAIIDTDTNMVKLEVRSAKPDSRWFNAEMRHAWYEEGALVDLYLAERGY